MPDPSPFNTRPHLCEPGEIGRYLPALGGPNDDRTTIARIRNPTRRGFGIHNGSRAFSHNPHLRLSPYTSRS
jgi:hypothetical protein